MAKRKTIRKCDRFEVFKRDSFTCQYCGAKAPNVVLNVDHIVPVAKGGDDHILNLITSCFSCNSGKSDVSLSSQQRIEKERTQLEKLNEQRLQLEMIAKWRNEIRSIDTESIELLQQEWEHGFGFTPNEVISKQLRLLLKRVGLVDAVKVVENTSKYFSADESDAFLLKKLRSQEEYLIAEKQRPGSSKIPYILGIIKCRHGKHSDLDSIGKVLAQLIQYESFSITGAIMAAKRSSSWREFENSLYITLRELEV